MKKYLLLGSVATIYLDDNYLVNTGSFIIGDFDTLEECKEKAIEELNGEACESAVDKGLDGKEADEYIENYIHNMIDYNITDNSLPRVNTTNVIIENEYDGGNWKESSIYTVIRII